MRRLEQVEVEPTDEQGALQVNIDLLAAALVFAACDLLELRAQI